GYPDGIAGEDIPLAARIVHAAAAYVGMRSERPYRAALAPEAAVAALESGSGTQFDPAVARAVAAVARTRLETERAA
ncbi:MAG TPA: HD domain-containing phosphohydrolase, partial [Gaiellaceae bacterium]